MCWTVGFFAQKHIARAAGIELGTLYDNMKAHILTRLFLTRGYPPEILVLGMLTHKNRRGA